MDKNPKIKREWTWEELKEKLRGIFPSAPPEEIPSKRRRKRGRGYTKSPHNERHGKIRRKIAKRSRQINRKS